VLKLKLIIMGINFRVNFNLFHLNHRLFPLGIMRSFLLLIPEFPVIHDFTYRRISSRRDFHQIKLQCARAFKRFSGRQNADLFAFRADDSHFRHSNPLIDSILWLCSLKMWSKSWSSHSLFTSSDN
jgi:hypothetical protein